MACRPSFQNCLDNETFSVVPRTTMREIHRYKAYATRGRKDQMTDDPARISEALVIWTGYGQTAWPQRDEQRLARQIDDIGKDGYPKLRNAWAVPRNRRR